METSKINFIDSVINGLKNAAAELEEFQLQLTLGKAEAYEKYEEVKKSFNEMIHEVQMKLNEEMDKPTDLLGKIQELQTLLSLGKTVTKEAFLTQKAIILKAVQDIESILKMTNVGTDLYTKISNEIQKFKIKLEILSLRFELGKMELKAEYEDRKTAFSNKIDNLKQKFSESEATLEKDWEKFSNEMVEAYNHLKKAFTH